MSEIKQPKIRVLIRKRPINKKQLSKSQTDIITIQNSKTVVVREQKLKVDLTPYIDQFKFNFDGAYDEVATNQQIYTTAIRPLVDCAFDGARVSCFAYGQTGSGKTHTMLGNGADVKGLYLLASIDIFRQLESYPSDTEAWISFYQIYCGKLYDLLNQKNILHARQDAKNNVNIVGLSETKIHNPQNLMQIIQYGTSIRVTSQNGTNNDSSRSHAILQITIKKKNKPHGKISFIDLAGSQRAADHADQLEKQTRIDGAQINKSLLALKECIRALDQNKNHTPFRGSKLTMVLKDSFTGYCRTVMIGNISPNSSSSQNTLNTLKYADRVKQLKKPTKENFLQMQKIDQLEKELMLPRNIVKKNPRTANNDSYNSRQLRENINSNFEPPFLKKSYEHHKIPINKMHLNNSIHQRQTGYHTDLKHPPMPQRNSHSELNNYHLNNMNLPINSNYNNFNGSLFPQKSVSLQKQFPYRQDSQYNLDIQNNLYLIQQNEPPAETIHSLQLNKLSQKYDQYVQIILQEQEALLRHHQEHINSVIELTKKEMLIKSEADKVGSSIENYLERLTETLDSKLNSIFSLKQRIQKMREHLEESKSLERQYQLGSRSLGLFQQSQGENQMLLDDDQSPSQQLFIN